MLEFIEDIVKIAKKLKCKTILDLGCGNCYVTSEMSKQFTMCGVELGTEEIRIAKTIYPCVVELDMRNALNNFRENSFDAVMTLDSLEHLSKNDSITLLKDCEKMAKKCVFHFTPINALSEEFAKFRYEQITKGLISFEEFQGGLRAHRSQWLEEEFKEIGYVTKMYKRPYNHVLAIKEL